MVTHSLPDAAVVAVIAYASPPEDVIWNYWDHAMRELNVPPIQREWLVGAVGQYFHRQMIRAKYEGNTTPLVRVRAYWKIKF